MMLGDLKWGSALWRQAPRRTVLLLILIGLSCVLFVWRSAVYQTQVVALQEQLHHAQLQSRQHKSGLPEDPQSHSKIVTQINSNKAHIDSLVPPLATFSEFLADLYACATDAGVEITQVSYQPDFDESINYWRYHLSFAVTSNYSKVKKFLFLLEQSPRLLRLEGMSLAGNQQARRSAKKVSVKLEITTFFKQDAS